MSKYKLNIQNWGPAGWDFIQAVSLMLPQNPTEQEKENYTSFFLSLKDVLPCSECRKHLAENIKTHPINVESPKECSLWIWSLHEEVNKTKGKTHTYWDMILDFVPPSMYSKFDFSSEEIQYLTEETLNRELAQKANNKQRLVVVEKTDDRNPVCCWWMWVIIALLVVVIAILAFVHCQNKKKIS